MNYGRILLGGMAAGLIINVGEIVLNVIIVGSDFVAAVEGAGVVEPSWSVPLLMFSGFVTGILAIWMYAAIRPRFGEGPTTAIYAGLAVWILYSGGFASFHLAIPFLPAKIPLATLAWGLIEVPLATVVGASLYREG